MASETQDAADQAAAADSSAQEVIDLTDNAPKSSRGAVHDLCTYTTRLT